MRQKILHMLFALLVCAVAHAQINSGSNGSDGAFNPATNTVINMADHPNGIYQYTSVTISNSVTVTFIPNANNTPVTWLVQSNCVINGMVDVSGQSSYVYNGVGGSLGGPGGGAGGNGGTTATTGIGPGGGGIGKFGGNASYGTVGGWWTNTPSSMQGFPGAIYGNSFILPLLGGSGGGGGASSGGGGGGAILIAASEIITLNGSVLANGGNTYAAWDQVSAFNGNGAGSGGAVRLVAGQIAGYGGISVSGGNVFSYNGVCCDYTVNSAGAGRIRFDLFQNSFAGSVNGVFTQGFQPIIILVAGQGVQLSIASVAGASISATPTGQLVSPDAIISGQQANPVPIVVNCANLPLNTLITVTVKPASGASVSAAGYNTTGTLTISTATVSLNMPRGGGIIYATAATSN